LDPDMGTPSDGLRHPSDGRVMGLDVAYRVVGNGRVASKVFEEMIGGRAYRTPLVVERSLTRGLAA
jgi:hypothetical protein